MNYSSIRAVIQYQEEKIAIVFEKDLREQEFLQICLQEFLLDPQGWNNFELVNVKLDCKIKTPKYLRQEDEFLLLRPSRFKFGCASQVLQEESFKTKTSLKSVDASFTSINNEVILGEILASKEEGEEDKEAEDDGLLEIEPFVLQEQSQQTEKNEGEEEKENVNLDECKINLDNLISKSFANRTDLKNQVIIEWGLQNKMKLNFQTRERVLIKEDCKITTILCSKKEKLGCPFYLEFKTEKNSYKLYSYWNVHNHNLNKYDPSKSIDNQIMDKIRELKAIAKSNHELTKSINKTFNKNFHPQTIYHQVKKMKDEEMGKVTEDAQVFIKMLEEDVIKYGGVYNSRFIENKLQGCCFSSKRMIGLLEFFSDVLVVDASHKTNRFNLPVLDVILINNYGQSCTCFFSLMPNQKYDSFEWSLSNFQKQLKKTPKVIFSDDEEALRKGKCDYLFHF